MKLWQKCPLCDGKGQYWDITYTYGSTSPSTCPVCLGKRIIETPDNPSYYFPWYITPTWLGTPITSASKITWGSTEIINNGNNTVSYKYNYNFK